MLNRNTTQSPATSVVTEFDRDVSLMLPILRSFQFQGDGKLSGAEYLKKYEKDLKSTGRLLQYLGLAEACEQSALGWRPSCRLLEIIGKQAARPLGDVNRSQTKTERALFRLLCDAVRDISDLRAQSGLWLLSSLGLLRTTDDLCYLVSKQLRELISEREW